MTTKQPEIACVGLKPRARPNGGISCLLEISRGDRILMTREYTLTKQKDFDSACQELIDRGVEPVKAEKMLHAVVTAMRQALDGAREQPADIVVETELRSRSMQIIEALGNQGRWLKTPADFLYFNGTTMTPVGIESLDMDVLLNARFKINETERISNFVKAEMKYHTAREGEEVEIHDLSYYDASRHCAYMYMGEGRVLKLNGKSREIVQNGEDNVLFRPSDLFESWEYQENHGFKLREFVGTFNFEKGGDSPFEVEEQQVLFLVLLIALYFKSIQPTKPIIVATGSPGSGKTSMLRALGQIMVGSRFDVNALNADKEDDFDTAVTNSSFLVYDNVDARVKWLENALATVATGGRKSKRILHTTNQIGHFDVDCFLGITSFAPKFRRPDVSERLLIFWLARRQAEERRPERWLQNLVKENRNVFLSEVADRINDTLATQEPSVDVSDIRMADFAFVSKWIAGGMSGRAGANAIENDIDRIIEKIRRSQQQFAGENNSLIVALKQWVLESQQGQLNCHREVLAKDLNAELQKIAEDEQLRWFHKPTTIAKAINQNMSVLESDFEVQTKIHTRTGNAIRIRLKSQNPPQAEFDETRVL